MSCTCRRSAAAATAANTLYIATADHSRHTTRHQLPSSLLPLTMPNVRLKPGDHVSAYAYEWDEPGGEDDDRWSKQTYGKGWQTARVAGEIVEKDGRPEPGFDTISSHF